MTEQLETWRRGRPPHGTAPNPANGRMHDPRMKAENQAISGPIRHKRKEEKRMKKEKKKKKREREREREKKTPPLGPRVANGCFHKAPDGFDGCFYKARLGGAEGG